MTLSKTTPVTLAAAADITGYSKAWLLKLAEQGYFKKEARGMYRIGDVVRGVIKFKDKEKKSAGHSAAHERLLSARAEEIEQRMRLASGELMPASQVNDLLMQSNGAFLARLDGFPAEMTRDIDLRRKMKNWLDRERIIFADILSKRSLEVSEDEHEDDDAS